MAVGTNAVSLDHAAECSQYNAERLPTQSLYVTQQNAANLHDGGPIQPIKAMQQIESNVVQKFYPCSQFRPPSRMQPIFLESPCAILLQPDILICICCENLPDAKIDI